MKQKNAFPTVSLSLYSSLLPAAKIGYAVSVPKVKAVPAVDPDLAWIEGAEFATAKDARKAAQALAVDAGRCATLEGSTRSERKLAASLGCREALESLSTVAAVVPTKKGHKVVTGKSALIVAAALARLEALKASGVRRDSLEYRSTVETLRKAA